MENKNFKVLEYYPFELLNPSVELVEGFKAYDGVLGDKKGDLHNGIDYARKDANGKFVTFNVFSTHKGHVFQGISKTRKGINGWGKFVVVRKEINVFSKKGNLNYRLDTIYAHLKEVAKIRINNKELTIPFFPKTEKETLKRVFIPAGKFLGIAGITGKTNRKIQLHFELHIKNLKTKERYKIDPYGVYNMASSGKYPKPGKSLAKIDHYWYSNNPLFSKKET